MVCLYVMKLIFFSSSVTRVPILNLNESQLHDHGVTAVLNGVLKNNFIKHLYLDWYIACRDITSTIVIVVVLVVAVVGAGILFLLFLLLLLF